MYSFEELQRIINTEIELRLTDLSSGKPVELYAPVAYALGMGGKRIRPALLLMSYNMFSEDIREALPAALAIEVFHNFTLLHDDIMDNSALRRNKLTVHKQFSENSAILSGDAMAFLSYKFLTECSGECIADVIELFTYTALEVCEGQQYDMEFEKRMDVTEAEYLEMIRLKTAVLLGCSLKAGSQLADADRNIADQFYSLGVNLGLAFQLQDDLLDTYGNKEIFGKKIGGDILANKKTYLLVKALETEVGENKSILHKWFSLRSPNEEDKIYGVIDIYNKLGIERITQRKIDFYFNNAFKILDDLPLEEKQKVTLKALGQEIQNRKY
jgi:geranylgeranyl diphosphate synthase, type II